MIWFGLFGACAAWALQELLSYGILSRTCVGPGQTAGGAQAAVGATSGALVLIGAAALLVAIGSSRRSDTARTRFMSRSGVLLSTLFLMGLLANFALLFLLPTCR